VENIYFDSMHMEHHLGAHHPHTTRG
jgi:hypothetical protein